MDTIEKIEVTAFKVPTDLPEADGTLTWDSTTLVLVQLRAGGISGLGYTYAHECCVPLIRDKLSPIVLGSSIMDINRVWEKMIAAVRNLGRQGVAATAIAAVDIALWDLKARFLNVPLVALCGGVRNRIAVYGSGGFTSYTERQLCRQLAGWVRSGIDKVKMKIGTKANDDPARVKAARSAIDKTAELFVDANGAYAQKQALKLAEQFAEQKVTWFEEPVSSENLSGLRFIRERLPASMELSAGEYNFDIVQAGRMLEAGSVDVLQADATRCGITGFQQMAGLCEFHQIPLSSHTAPALHGHLCCAAGSARHAEYFHDHVRIEQLFFEGATTRHKNGFLEPDRSQPGLGLIFKERDASPYQINV